MADYHPLILRAVEGLDKNTGENRRALYERARTALVAQLRGVQPALDESEITRERLALEEAIRKVEAESARRAREEPRKPPPPRPAAPPPRRDEPRRDEPVHAAPPPPPPPPPPVSEPAAPPEPDTWAEFEPQSAAQPAPNAGHAEPPPSAPPPRPSGDHGSLADQAMRGFRSAIGDPTAAARSARPAAPPPRNEAQAPPPRRGGSEQRRQPIEDNWEPPSEQVPPALPPPPSFDFSEDPHAHRPRRPEQRDEPDEPRQARQPVAFGRFAKIGLIALIGVALGVAVWWQRDAISGAASSLVALVGGSTTTSKPAASSTPSTQKPKISDRIGQPQQAGAPAVAQRVVLYEEDPADPQGKRLLGTAVWRTEMLSPAPGRPAEMAIRAEVEVPERQLKMLFSLRRNADKSLPASHTIEIQFNLPGDSPTGGVQNVPGVLMKQAEQTRGVPLAGLAVKVTPGFFLIGLSALEADMQRNLQLLKERSWFDIPMVYATNRRAILAMEKGTPGERAFNEAFAAWGQ
jgi:hypothetical protein